MIDKNNIFDEIDLNIFKCKKVKSPTKSWEAAGWDFFIPENLTIFDFAKSYKAYLDESIPYDKNMRYIIPLIFYIKSNRTIGEYKCQLVLTWNETINEWAFNICEYSKDNILVSMNDISDEIIQWLTEDDTVISKIEMLPHSKINIPSGIHVNLPNNVYLKVENKSGIASKRGLSYLASVIDYDYMGEIHLNLVNTQDLSVIIQAGEKIVQMLPMFQPNMNNVKEYESLDKLYKNKKSARGSGGFGSSGEK